MPVIVVGETARRIAGTDRSRGGSEIIACCHCPVKFEYRRGSGRVRGYCMSCDKIHCGGPSCWECRPHDEDEWFGKRLDQVRLAQTIEGRLNFGRALGRVLGRPR